MMEIDQIVSFVGVALLPVIGWLFKKIGSFSDRLTRLEVQIERMVSDLETRRKEAKELFNCKQDK